MKECSKCKENKLEDRFDKCPRGKNGLKSYCKDCSSKMQKDLREKRTLDGKCTRCGKDKLVNYHLCASCKDKHINRNIKYESTSKYKETNKKYYQDIKHTEHHINWRKNYMNTRLAEDVCFKLKHNLRNRLRAAIKINARKGSAVRDLGCSIEFFKEYIQSLFLPGMTFDNYGCGIGKWGLDHKIPLHSVDLTNKEELLKVCHYTNLRPLWHVDNVKRNTDKNDPFYVENLCIKKELKCQTPPSTMTKFAE